MAGATHRCKGVDALSNRTKIRAYDDGDFNALLAVLHQNRRRLKVNPDTRAIQERVESEFNESTAKLMPSPKLDLAATDRLIDLIVCHCAG